MEVARGGREEVVRCGGCEDPAASCVNLQERFGRRYRVGWEADGATKGLWPKDDWPWLMEIRGRHGVVSPKGGDVLQAMTPHRRVGARLRALPWCVAIARGEEETVVTFHVDDAAAVFKLIRPYRRRRVSEAERRRLAALSARFGFGAGHISESDFPALESTIASRCDSGIDHGDSATLASRASQLQGPLRPSVEVLKRGRRGVHGRSSPAAAWIKRCGRSSTW